MVLKLVHFGKYIRTTWKVVRCGAVEERWRSVGPIVINEEVFLRVKMERNILHAIKRSSVYDCTVEDVENVSVVTHSHHLVVVITLP